ncbi:abscisic acid receptor PYR1-like [Macadamia integrifolia]|uniref:abscisic acid receptor PYR1-like n=1 Tax=Macadamia integrifolia TaxID=60698 RepID=UPI001C4E717E|nr:abscisic acid receptor PYR1-like [Macadamia integrifolia]XP_042489953.1 abscisic acid receptor PYR1-like [Macadamia integrifolia]XP_042489954.1 abscisic acid receptor PYR1-like [Macadamia integrifolia]
MEKEESSSSMAENEDSGETITTHQTKIPAGLTQEEFEELKPIIHEFHTYRIGSGKCSSLLAQRIYAPAKTVWSIVRPFDKPQAYKHFIKNCSIKEGDSPPPTTVGCLREVNVISGLPADTSTERLDVLDDERKVTGFTIIGGEHRLRNYRSVTSVNEFKGGRRGGGGDQYDGEKIWTVVLESYVVDVPEGNTEDDTRMFADTVVRLNLQKLASVTEGLAGDRSR